MHLRLAIQAVLFVRPNGLLKSPQRSDPRIRFLGARRSYVVLSLGGASAIARRGGERAFAMVLLGLAVSLRTSPKEVMMGSPATT